MPTAASLFGTSLLFLCEAGEAEHSTLINTATKETRCFINARKINNYKLHMYAYCCTVVRALQYALHAIRHDYMYVYNYVVLNISMIMALYLYVNIVYEH